jgi:hypothetical protein
MQIKPQIVQAIISVRNFPSHEEPYLYNSITYPHGYSLACTISCTTHHGLEQSRLRRECVHYHYTVVRIRENSSTSKLRPPTLPEVGRRYSYAEDGAVLLHHDIRCLAVPVAVQRSFFGVLQAKRQHRRYILTGASRLRLSPMPQAYETAHARFATRTHAGEDSFIDLACNIPSQRRFKKISQVLLQCACCR